MCCQIPPYPELEPPESQCVVGLVGNGKSFHRPQLSDFSCGRRELKPIPASLIIRISKMAKYRPESVQYQPVLNIEGSRHFEQTLETLSENCPFGEPLLVVDFFATWCGPCQTMAPVFRQFSRQFPAAHFLKVDTDDCDKLAAKHKIESLPTVKIMRGPKVLQTIEGGGPQFVKKLAECLQNLMVEEEKKIMDEFRAPEHSVNAEFANSIQTTKDEVLVLASKPLAALQEFTQSYNRQELGLAVVEANCDWDVSYHEASHSAVAKSMLDRMKEDVVWWSDTAQSSSIMRVCALNDEIVQQMLNGDTAATALVQKALLDVVTLLGKLQELRDQDATLVQSMVPILTQVCPSVQLLACTTHHYETVWCRLQTLLV